MGVNTIERAQIRLLLDHLQDETRTESEKGHEALHGEHAAAGRLESGATIKAALRIAEDLAAKFVSKAFDAAAGVVVDAAAFDMVLAEVTLMVPDLKRGIDRAVSFSERNGPGSISREADRLFSEIEHRTYRLAEIRKFEFVRGAVAADPAPPPVPAPATETPRVANKGGAPLAAHWDEMWADIAVQLWNGDLQPKRQKDISDAMFAWLIAHELEAGHTAVTDRARALWSKVRPS